MQQNEPKELDEKQSANEAYGPFGVEKTAWELRNEWRKAYNTHRRIRAHIAKICDGKHTMLADDGVRILQEEATRLLREIKAIEEHFKHKRWAL